MPSSVRYYAVRVGASPGVYRTWDEACAAVVGISGARHKRFSCAKRALEYLAAAADIVVECECTTCTTPPPPPPPPPSKRHRSSSDSQRPSSRTKRIKAGGGDSASPSAESTEPPPPPDSALDIYTDGAVSHNGNAGRARGGVGVWFGAGDARNIAAPYTFPMPITNNRAELAAVIVALRSALDQCHHKRLEQPPPPTRVVVIHTDSRYVCDAAARRGIAARFANVDLVQPMLALIDELERRCGVQVRFEHVRGHAHNFGNVDADALARAGAMEDARRRDALGDDCYRDDVVRRARLVDAMGDVVEQRQQWTAAPPTPYSILVNRGCVL